MLIDEPHLSASWFVHADGRPCANFIQLAHLVKDDPKKIEPAARSDFFWLRSNGIGLNMLASKHVPLDEN